MAARPRLVHEGSPITEDGDSGSLQFSVATTWSKGAHRHASRSNLATVSSAANKTSAASKPYKLQTTLVVGDSNEEDDDLDTMMMDEDAHTHNQHESSRGHDHTNFLNQQGSSNHGVFVDHSTSRYYGSHGHVEYGHHEQRQQHNNVMEHMPFATAAQHQQPMMHQQPMVHQQQIHQPQNNGFVPANPIIYPSPQMYHMPSPATSPLVVLDAANIAYNYAESSNPAQQNQRRQPDPRGIRLAIDYFLKYHCRVQAVVPISWYRLKPNSADHYHLQNRGRGDSDAKMVTEEVEELRNLRQQGFLVACPPGDDDDAYALALARREEDRLMEQNRMQRDESMGMEEDSPQNLPASVLGGYVVSNDFFQDAIRRDAKKHQQHPLNMRPTSLKSWLKKNRISYSFANVGTTSDGEIQLEFLPNPRNDLIEAIDACNRLKCGMR
ncbi:hypothetical protein ACHAXR_002905 [Thalassiosira sp. AJA248-18]